MNSELVEECFCCGEKIPVEEVMLLKRNFICKRCYKEKKYKHSKYRKTRTKKEISLGIFFCVLASVLFLFALWFWVVEINEGEGIMATAMAGGIIAVAIALFKLGLSAFN